MLKGIIQSHQVVSETITPLFQYMVRGWRFAFIFILQKSSLVALLLFLSYTVVGMIHVIPEPSCLVKQSGPQELDEEYVPIIMPLTF